MTPANDKRADRALAAVKLYNPRGEPESGDFADLLVDMMHLAKREGYDMPVQIRNALFNFEQEQRDD